ncbi:MAG: dinitrogenase iron-molybdenum cofactor biosynthesis protein [Kosmotoga sp.]|nr:MAG: dinitrogenase iron-molybdenum cofactor biosynthesis protein [Kosmotoga sp.]
MIIAVPVEEKTLDSKVDERFARSEHMLIYDTDNNTVNYAENDDLGAHGAGPVVVEKLVNNKVSHLICKNLGKNAYMALQQAAIKAYMAEEGTAKENIERLKNGDLKSFSTPRDKHYGM